MSERADAPVTPSNPPGSQPTERNTRMTRSNRPARIATAGGLALTMVGGAVAGAIWLTPSAEAGERASAALEPATALAGYSVTTSSNQVGVGDSVTLTVATTSTQDLYAYDLDITFDPSVLSYDEGSAASNLTGSTYDAAGVGEVHVVHSKLGSSPATTGDAQLATLSFTALAAGATNLVAAEIVLVDSTTARTTVDDVGTTPVTVRAASTPAPTQAPTATPAPTSLATVSPKVGKAVAGKPVKVKLTVASASGSAATAGRVKILYAGKMVKRAKPVRNGKVVVYLPPKPRGSYRLVTVFIPDHGSGRVRTDVRVAVRG